MVLFRSLPSNEGSRELSSIISGRTTAPTTGLTPISGSTGITGAVDTVAALFRERGRMDATLRITGRDLDNEPEVALAFDAGVWRELGPAAEYRLANERSEVLDLFGELGSDVLTAATLADHLEITVTAARQRLSRMARDGELTSIKRGHYVKTVTEVTSHYLDETSHDEMTDVTRDRMDQAVHLLAKELGATVVEHRPSALSTHKTLNPHRRVAIGLQQPESPYGAMRFRTSLDTASSAASRIGDESLKCFGLLVDRE